MSGEGKYDVIVVGCGAHGSAALYHLARRGLKVRYDNSSHQPHRAAQMAIEHTCQDRMQIKPSICSDKSCGRCLLHLLESIDKARYVCMSWINLLETEPLHLL